jgi:hypothetical protein
MTTKRKALIGGMAIAALSCLTAVAFAGGAWTPWGGYLGQPLPVSCGSALLSGVDCSSPGGVCVVGSSFCAQECRDSMGHLIPPSTNAVAFVRCKGGSTNGVW